MLGTFSIEFHLVFTRLVLDCVEKEFFNFPFFLNEKVVKNSSKNGVIYGTAGFNRIDFGVLLYFKY